MIDPTVRPATGPDAVQLAGLETEARRAVAEQRGGVRWLDTHPSRNERWVECIDASHVVVAHIGDVLVGYIVLVGDGPVVTVDDVWVTPEARELGFGDELLAAAVDSARRRGATTLEGASLPGDRDTKNLYERAGIKARMIVVSTEL